MTVLVTDQLIAGYLGEPSWEVVTGRPDAEVIARLSDVEVLVTGRVTRAMAEAATKLRLLHVPGAGLDRVALDALRNPVAPQGLPVEVANMSGVDDLLSTSDIVVLTVPLTDDTRGMNVVMTPPNSGHTAEVFAGRAAEIRANVARLEAGEPLANVVRAGR